MVNVIACNVYVDVMMKRVRRGKASLTQACQVTVVNGAVVTATLYVVSVADGCCILHCRLHQRFDHSLLELTGLSCYQTTLLCNMGVTIV